ncbi:NAD(P)H-binding protein [Candidatus Nitrosotenuis cloacae]|uniref:NAD(P)H-binding protein n=1 Tax=Candidatus Nitrosotenuis cloacae TaxID=1603555 RepID=UPI0015A5ABD9|nr:NAD(P)H-binding protein [Candidatus Nitrosotenuis cloacae]
MEKSKPVISISGSTGFVGTNLGKFLSSQNISVINLSRKKQKSFKSKKTLVFSDIDDIPKIHCDALVHLIGTGAQTTSSDYESVNVRQTQKIINLCKKSKIKKIIYISGLGVSDNTTFGYFISKLKAERLIKESRLDYTILRASYIVGSDDPLSQNLTRQIKNGTILVPGSGSYRLQPISIHDVCRVILESVHNKNLSNKTVDLVGPKTISFANYVKKFARGKKAKIKKIPLEQAYFDALNNPENALYGIDDLNIMIGDFTSSHHKLEKLSGIKLKTPEIL